MISVSSPFSAALRRALCGKDVAREGGVGAEGHKELQWTRWEGREGTGKGKENSELVNGGFYIRVVLGV